MTLAWLVACHADHVDLDRWPLGGGDESAVDSSGSRPVRETAAEDSAEVLPHDTDDAEPLPTPDVVVDCTGGADHTRIADAIAASPSGTRIGLRACTYEERIDFVGKTLDIYGLDGRDAVIVDASRDGTAVTAVRGESLGTRLAHLTLTGGRNNGGASAIYVDASVLALEDVLVTGNSGYATVYALSAWLDLVDVEMTGNAVADESAAILTDNGSIHALRTTIDCDDGSYGIYEHNVTMLADSEVTCDGGEYGVLVSGGEIQLRRSVVRGGSAGLVGEDNADTLNERAWFFNSAVLGGDVGASLAYMHVKADNAVFYGGRHGLKLSECNEESYVYDSVGVGSQCGIRGEAGRYTLAFDAYRNDDNCGVTGASIVDADPGFVAAPDDLHLADDSPLVDRGMTDDAHRDADGSRNDIGMYGGPGATP